MNDLERDIIKSAQTIMNQAASVIAMTAGGRTSLAETDAFLLKGEALRLHDMTTKLVERQRLGNLSESEVAIEGAISKVMKELEEEIDADEADRRGHEHAEQVRRTTGATEQRLKNWPEIRDAGLPTGGPEGGGE